MNVSWFRLFVENRICHRSPFFDECLRKLAQFGFEALVLAYKKGGTLQLISSFWKVELFSEAHFSMNASASLLSLALTPLVLAGKKGGMLKLISSFWKVVFFIEADFLINASANLLSLPLKPLPWQLHK